jgi:hypothetical protein
LEEDNKNNRNIKMEILNADAIKKHPKLFTRVSNLNEAILQRSANGKNVSNGIYNFSINTNLCKMITVDGLTTYTFEVIREQNNGFFENLVVKELANGTFETKLFRYNVTLQEKHNILNGIDVDMTNKISTLPIDDTSFVSDLFSRIYFNGFCYESSTVYVPGTPCGGIRQHNWNEACPHAGTSLAAQPPSTQVVYTMVSCPDTGGGGGGGPSGPSDGGGSGGSGPTSPTGPGLPTYEGEDPIPCDKLKQVSLAMKERLNDIDDAASASNCEKCEFGYQMEYNSTSSQITTGPLIESGSNFIATDYILTSIGLIHSHAKGLHQMFSFSDVLSLYYLNRLTNPANIPLGVIYLVSPSGITYAIKTDNASAFKNWMEDKYKDTQGKDATEKIGNLNDKLANQHLPITPFGPSINEREKLEEDFIKFFEGANLSIYSTTDSNYQNWHKLTLSNNNQTRIKPIPCN